MIKQRVVDAAGTMVLGVEVDLPNAPLVMLLGRKGFVGCGYLKLEVADRFEHALAIVSGVRSIEDALAAPVKAVSRAAAEHGVETGMTGAEAARLLA